MGKTISEKEVFDKLKEGQKPMAYTHEDWSFLIFVVYMIIASTIICIFYTGVILLYGI